MQLVSFSVCRAGTRRLPELAAFPAPLPWLLSATRGAAAATRCRAGSRVSSQDKIFRSPGEGAHRGKVSLEMSAWEGGALACVENQSNLGASQALILLASHLPDPYPSL